jgi:hypothetical protein
MSKYERYSAVVNRNADENISEDHWLKQFEKSLQKGAVQPRTQESLFDQINSIMNRKSKYPSVEAAVEDMKNRSGLTAYLDHAKRAAEEEQANIKIAADENDHVDKKMPIVIKKYPAIRKTLENCIRDTKGNLPIPAIIERVRSIHQGDVSDAKDWDDDKLLYLVSNLNLEAKKNNPSNFEDYSNLGGRDSGANQDVDPSNTDAFFALNPAKI